MIEKVIEVSAEDTPFLKNAELSTLGKIFFASFLNSMNTGKKSPFRISGDRDKIAVLMKVSQCTKDFHDEIKKPEATIDSVIRAMDLKNIEAKNFYNTFKFPWPL